MSSDKKFFGTYGSLTINPGSGAKTGLFYAVQCIGETTFTTLTDETAESGGVNLNTLTFADGTIIYGNFSAVTVATGAARCYKTPPNSQ